MTKENRLIFIYNPRSGKGQIKNKLSDIINCFAEAGKEITVHPTQCAKDALETIKRVGAQQGGKGCQSQGNQRGEGEA